MAKIQVLDKRSSVSTMTLLQALYKMPIMGISDVIKATGLSQMGAYNLIDRLIKMDILSPLYSKETTYGQKWVYLSYFNAFTEEK